jgi:tRNA pseudouridine55 synthase
VDGIISIIKPPGLSSHDVVSWARKQLNTRKIGHSGTLDPGAAGILVLGVGKGTKLLEYIQSTKKTYRAEIILGFETDTGDMFGEKIDSKEVNLLSQNEWDSVLSSFVGDKKQLPPMTSALKKDGVPLYKLARSGKDIERELRNISIFDITLVDIYQNKILFDVTCSKGTYIRVLCQDIARLCNNVGTMSFLLRTAVGPFNIENSNTMNESVDLLPLNLAIEHLYQVELNEEQVIDIKHGRLVHTNLSDKDIVALIDSKESLIAIAYIKNGYIHPRKVFI